MDHQNIIKMHDVYESPSELQIVMEVCEGGELFDRIKEQPDGNYSENDAADVLRQIAEGLKYMHDHKIAHCVSGTLAHFTHLRSGRAAIVSKRSTTIAHCMSLPSLLFAFASVFSGSQTR